MFRKKTPLTSLGFTFIELVIVIVIVTVMFSYAAPGFKNLVLQNRAASVTEELITALAAARLEAVTRKTNISLCRSTDGEACSGVGDWAEGYILYVDSSPELEDTTTIQGDAIKFFSGIHRTANISLQRNGTDVSFVRFTRLGTVARIENFDPVFTINIDGCKDIDAQRRVTVSFAGIPSNVRQSCPGE